VSLIVRIYHLESSGRLPNNYAHNDSPSSSPRYANLYNKVPFYNVAMEITPEYIRESRKKHRWYETLLKNTRLANDNSLKSGHLSQDVYDVLMKDRPIMEEFNRIDGRIIDLLEREMLGIETWEDKEEVEELQEKMRNFPKLDRKDLDELIKNLPTRDTKSQ